MCWVITSTKLAVVQCESSVGGSPRTATRITPPFFGTWASATVPSVTKAVSTRARAAIRPVSLIADLLGRARARPGAGPEGAAIDRDRRGDGDVVRGGERGDGELGLTDGPLDPHLRRGLHAGGVRAPRAPAGPGGGGGGPGSRGREGTPSPGDGGSGALPGPASPG